MIFASPTLRIPMLDFLGRLSWLFFNIGVPVCAPIALLPLLRFSRFYRHTSKGIAMRTVQDGQLFWVVISMCASACYEIGCALGEASSDNARALMFAGLLWHGVAIVASSILVLFGSADSTPHQAHRNGDELPDHGLMWLSIFATAIMGASYALSHYSLT
jgi:hypothetical protein